MNLTYTESRFFGGDTIHQIMVIEYYRNKPHSVVTNHGTFDFEWCKKYGLLYFTCSGSGCGREDPDHSVCAFVEPASLPGKIWTAPNVRLHRWESRDKPEIRVDDAILKKMGYRRLKQPLLLKDWRGNKTRNPFEAGEECDGHMEYCSICDDYLPDESLCDHLMWSDSNGMIFGSGGERPGEETFFAALDWLAAQKMGRFYFNHETKSQNLAQELELLLRAGQFPPSCYVGSNVLHEARDSENWDDMEDGFVWLQTLQRKGTEKANAETLAWIQKWKKSRKDQAGKTTVAIAN